MTPDELIEFLADSSAMGATESARQRTRRAMEGMRDYLVGRYGPVITEVFDFYDRNCTVISNPVEIERFREIQAFFKVTPVETFRLSGGEADA